VVFFNLYTNISNRRSSKVEEVLDVGREAVSLITHKSQCN